MIDKSRMSIVDNRGTRRPKQLMNSLSALCVMCFIFLNTQVIFVLNCPTDKWACSNGIECINATSRCNSVVDCGDGSDEGAFCSKHRIFIRILLFAF